MTIMCLKMGGIDPNTNMGNIIISKVVLYPSLIVVPKHKKLLPFIYFLIVFKRPQKVSIFIFDGGLVGFSFTPQLKIYDAQLWSTQFHSQHPPHHPQFLIIISKYSSFFFLTSNYSSARDINFYDVKHFRFQAPAPIVKTVHSLRLTPII